MNRKNDFIIRKMTLDDVAAVTEIEAGCFSEPWNRSDFESSVKADYDIGIVAESEEGLVGFCILRCSYSEADIINVAVIPEARRLGAGTLMIDRLLEEGRKSGVSEFILEVRVSNEPAIRLYKNKGFVNIGIRKAYYSSPVEDAGIMKCVFQ